MRIEDFIDENRIVIGNCLKREAQVTDRLKEKFVIGQCRHCTQFIHSGDPSIYEGECDSDLHSTPENCYQDFGCIHFIDSRAGV